MELGLAGKKAIVTGGSGGIGAAIAAELAREGVDLCLVATDAARLDEAAAQAGQRGTAQIMRHATDLRQPQAAAEAVDAALARFGRLDILVNCAGATKRGDFFGMTEADWDDGFDLKFRGAVRMIRHAWPHLRQAQGCVLNIIGVGGWSASEEFSIGGSVNAALLHFTKVMAAIGLHDGVRVNALNPGRIQTGRLARNIDRIAALQGISVQEASAEVLRSCGIRRFGQPEEISAVAAFMLSERASYLQGALVDVDGGQTRSL